jgi:ribosome-binding protein aMBF1 (putative translation factor)
MTKLEQARRRRDWSQTDLAAKAGRLSAADISRFERGWQKPYPAQAKRLARVLSLAPAELTTEASE